MSGGCYLRRRLTLRASGTIASHRPTVRRAGIKPSDRHSRIQSRHRSTIPACRGKLRPNAASVCTSRIIGEGAQVELSECVAGLFVGVSIANANRATSAAVNDCKASKLVFLVTPLHSFVRR
jgi:hypothetical protein